VQRAIAAAFLAEKLVKLSNVTPSDDSNAALRVIQALGAQVRIHQDEIFIYGRLNPSGEVLDCGEAGLSIRMFAPIAALWHEALTLSGEGSLLKRPVSMVENPLKQMGVTVTTSNGFPPLTIRGPLKGGDARVDGSVSSQILTGLLIALPKASEDSRLRVDHLQSTPYIDMTLDLLKRFSIGIRHNGYEEFFIQGRQAYRIPRNEYRVEGDWSGAAFLLVAGAVGGAVVVTGLDTGSPQADRRIISALQEAGATVRLTAGTVEISRSQLKAFQFDATHCPDLFPPLAVLACNCEGKTVLTGVERLIHKESNRARALEQEISALGGDIHIHGNQMEINGKILRGGVMDSHRDHRIAMAGAVAAIRSRQGVSIRDSECVAKSYPRFFEDLKSLGVKIHE
jgi:3-phosphoshikimate 1-carboxyvinyltransferase